MHSDQHAQDAYGIVFPMRCVMTLVIAIVNVVPREWKLQTVIPFPPRIGSNAMSLTKFPFSSIACVCTAGRFSTSSTKASCNVGTYRDASSSSRHIPSVDMRNDSGAADAAWRAARRRSAECGASVGCVDKMVTAEGPSGTLQVADGVKWTTTNGDHT